MKKQEKAFLVLMLAGLILIFSPITQSPDPTVFEIVQLLMGFIVLVIGAARFIWSENDKQ